MNSLLYCIIIFLIIWNGIVFINCQTLPDSTKLEEEMLKNREYQCVASCFGLTKTGGPKPKPDCTSNYDALSTECEAQGKKLGKLEKKPNTPHYFINNEKKNWHEASRFCREYNMQLVSIESEVENKALGEILGKDKSEYWTSGCDHVSDNQWYWVETGEDFDYRNWDAGEPHLYTKKDILRGVFLKVDPDKSSSNLKWADANCDDERKSICEMPDTCYRQFCNTN